MLATHKNHRSTTETGHKNPKDVDNKLQEHIYIGNKYKSTFGGVGFILHKDLIDEAEIDIQQGAYENSLFLTIKTQKNLRKTTFCAIYGKANASKQIAEEQWGNISLDIDKI